MITFEYDKDGNLLTYKDGKLVGSIITMGDLIKKESPQKND